MKKCGIFLAIFSILCLFSGCTGSQTTATVAQGVIRLHILANSDSQADQDMKLKVRDFLLEKWGKKLEGYGTADKAWAGLADILPQIQQDVVGMLKEKGAAYGATAESGVFNFPAKDYNGVSFPQGQYRALKISLGAAAGHNWWCVIFPPLCLMSDGDMDMEQYRALVQKLEEGGAIAEGDAVPTAPVRSWLFDKLVGEGQWDKDFLQWAKKYWISGDGK